MADSGGKTAVTVRIGGEEHTIRANVEPEYTRRCAEWVDQRMVEIRSQIGLLENHKVAILAALSITDELFQTRTQLEEVRHGVVGRVGALAFRLEEAISESEAED
jgi:cell division protein ZapA